MNSISWEQEGLMVAGCPLEDPKGSQGQSSRPLLDEATTSAGPDGAPSCTEIMPMSHPPLVLSYPIYVPFNRLPHEPLFSLFPLVLSSLEIKK